MLHSLHPEVQSLRKSILRQVDLLPVNYLRVFFRIKFADDLRALSKTKVRSYRSKYKRVVKELRKLEAANNGDVKAYAHILDTAYGRIGKLKWELMEPILKDPCMPLPDRLIPSVEKSRPPEYLPPLKALMASSISHTTRPLAAAALQNLASFPERINPKSEEARLIGPFSKRREVNLRWRFFTTEWKKLLPPLLLEFEGRNEKQEIIEEDRDRLLLAKAGVRGFGFQMKSILDEIKAIAGPPYKPRSIPPTSTDSTDYSCSLPKTNRFIRRRYQALLARIPILTYTYHKMPTGMTAGGYRVSLAPNGIGDQLRFNPGRLPYADEDDLAWIAASEKGKGTPSKKLAPKDEQHGIPQ